MRARRISRSARNVKSQTERLTRLSEDLLFLTSEDGEAPGQDPVEVDAILREVVRQLAPSRRPGRSPLKRLTPGGSNCKPTRPSVPLRLEPGRQRHQVLGEGSHVILRAAGTMTQ